MIKRIFLFSLLFLIISGTIFAQYNYKPIKKDNIKTLGFKKTKPTKSAITSNWYNFPESVYKEGKSVYNSEVLFPDTLPVINYETEMGRPYVHSIATIMDPFSNSFSYFGDEQVVLSPYNLDSIGFYFSYTRERLDDIADTLIFEYWKIEDAEVSNYQVTEYEIPYIFVDWDETNYTTSPKLPGVQGFTKYIQKVAISTEDVSSEANNFVSNVSFKTNLNVGKWGVVGCAVSFKPGYTYSANDTLNNMNYVQFFSLEEEAGAFNEFTGDYNCSHILPTMALYTPFDTVVSENGDSTVYFNDYYMSSYHFDYPEYPFEHHAFEFLISSEIPKINLVTLNGGEQNVVGSTVDIKWTSNGTSNVKIEYIGGNATTWQTIVASVATLSDSTNVYKWTIPTNFKDDSNYKIKISDVNYPNNVYDESENSFTIGVPSLAFVYPELNSVLYAGTTQNIRWNSNYIDSVKIEIITVSYSNIWETVVSSVSASSGSYMWITPSISSKDCKIKITDLKNSSMFAESGKFTIKNPIIQVSSPNGGEKILKGAPVKLEWLSEDVTNVKIQFQTNANGEWFLIAASAIAADGYYVWLNPNILSTECKIKISDASYPNAFDLSDSTFSIVASLGINSTSSSEMDGFIVFPNPANDQLNINFINNNINVVMQISDYTGKIVKTESLNNINNTINVSNISSGMYFIKLTDNKNNNQTIKFIKK